MVENVRSETEREGLRSRDDGFHPRRVGADGRRVSGSELDAI